MSVFIPPLSPHPNVFNFSPQYLKFWRRALGRVRAGSANSRVIFIGDSTTIGINSSGTATWPSLTDAIASMIAGSGTPCNANGWSGASSGGTATGSRQTTDPRIVPGNWAATTTGTLTLGGGIFKTSSSGTALQYTPTAQADTFNVFYSPYGSGGSATLQAGTGTSVTINETTDTGPIATKTVTADALGTKTLKATYVSGSSIYIEGMEAYNSAQKSVNIMNAGWWGSLSSNWNDTSNTFSSIPMLEYLAPDLTVITAGINDWGNSVAVSTFTANIQALITAAQLSGDVMLVTPAPNNSNLSIQPNYIAALYQLAAANNCVLVDNYARWVSYALSNGIGLYSDGFHPTATGYADQAQAIKTVMLGI